MEEEVFRSNLSTALYQAIILTREQEKAQGYTGPSGFLSAIQDLKKKVDSGECHSIHIKD